MTATLPTIATCPRDATALSEEGVYVHRRIAEQLVDAGIKIWSNEKEKTAFVTASPAERAQAIANALKDYDAKNGKPAAAATSTPEAPAAEAASPAPVRRAARSPQTTASKAEDKPNGVSSHAGGTDMVQALLVAIKDLGDKVDGLSKDNAQLGKQLITTETALTDLRERVNQQSAIVEANFGLLNLFGQQVLGAPMEAFLEDAVKDATKGFDILEAIVKAAKGKG